MSTLELVLIVTLFTENIALLLAPMWDTPHRDRDAFGESATRAMRRTH
ncbi:hypothetical protein [Rhodococcus sp. AH-ZY2]|nr:hypothetical protein [Rhodococcus sp. AH-ZY2]WML63197.1 hypothetical protein QNA09_25880 [Rhodococcus sp. AH-ZY2]